MNPLLPLLSAAALALGTVSASAAPLTASDAVTTAATASADQPVMQPALADRLAAAAPDEVLRVFVHAADVTTAADAVSTAGLSPVTTWDRIGVAVADGLPAQITAVAAAAGVTYVEADQELDFTLSTSHQATRGEQARSLTGADGTALEGTGVSIAIIDSGIDGTHPFFTLPDGTSKVKRNLKDVCLFLSPGAPYPNGTFNDACFVDEPTNDTDTPSMGGHGTHVAGIAAGVDATTLDGRDLHGAAPGATLIGLSVGQLISIYGGNAGMNWVLENHADPCGDGSCPPIRVTNHSYGPPGGGEFDPNSATSKLQDALIADGVAVVWAAGNDGGDGSEVLTNPPGQSPTGGVLMVANYDDADSGARDNALAPSSARGQDGRPETYPDIAAPGTDITSACTPLLPICSTGFDLRDPNYNTISGTSMAAPHIAGIVAQLFQADPTLTPAQVEDVLEDTAHQFTAGAAYETDPRNPDHTTSFDKGHGLVDVTAAAARVLGIADPGTGTTTTACVAGTPQVTDAAGDATGVISGVGGLPNEPGLDIVEAEVSGDAATGDTIFRISVADLPDAPGGTEGDGEYFDFNFGYAGGSYHITMNRSLTGGESFTLGRFETTRTRIGDLTGSFDPATDQIIARLPADAIANGVPGAPVVADGVTFDGFEVVARRDAVLLVPDADSAKGTCPYVVGATAAPAPTTATAKKAKKTK